MSWTIQITGDGPVGNLAAEATRFIHELEQQGQKVQNGVVMSDQTLIQPAESYPMIVEPTPSTEEGASERRGCC